MPLSENSTVKRALPLLQERLDDYGYQHSLSAAQTAFDLAFLYNVNSDDAYLATLLHDWDRGQPWEYLLETAQHIGIEVNAEIEAAPFILHAHTGAYQVQKLFPELPPHIITAIRHHTVGSENMSDLDKVVYIADMMEPTRVSPGADTMRELAGTLPLDQLFVEAYYSTMLHLIHNRKVMHPQTTHVWNTLLMASDRHSERLT